MGDRLQQRRLRRKAGEKERKEGKDKSRGGWGDRETIGRRFVVVWTTKVGLEFGRSHDQREDGRGFCLIW